MIFCVNLLLQSGQHLAPPVQSYGHGIEMACKFRARSCLILFSQSESCPVPVQKSKSGQGNIKIHHTSNAPNSHGGGSECYAAAAFQCPTLPACFLLRHIDIDDLDRRNLTAMNCGRKIEHFWWDIQGVRRNTVQNF